MAVFFFGRRAVLIAPVVLLLALGMAVVLLLRNQATGPPPQEVGFRESAGEAGLDFRMAFLPAEQGKNFKINLYDHGCGVAVGDFDGDGYDDVYFCNQLATNALYRNKGDGTFEDVTAKAGVGLGDRICVAATWADYDNSGRQSLFVTSTHGGNVLFKNQGDGTFKDVTKEAGLACVAHSQTAVFFDYDNDGYLDLLVTNTAQWTLPYDAASHYYPGVPSFWELATSPREPNILYHNNGDGTFTDVTAKAGLQGKGWGGDVAVFDYNDDGYLDVFITNMFGASQLYRNNGNGTFTDVTKEVLGRTSFGAIGCKVFDCNNDGRLDLFITDMHSDMWIPTGFDPSSEIGKEMFDPKRKYTKLAGPFSDRPGALKWEARLQDAFGFHNEDVIFGNTLFKKLPSGKFAEVSDQANLETFWPWGIVVGDFDNDGFEDVYIPSGMGYPYGYWPNALMINNGNGTFTDRAAEARTEPPPGGKSLDEQIAGQPAARSSRCAAVADFSGTGRLDLVVNNFNGQPYYFRNQFPRKNYVAFRLTGTTSNRDAIGALVTLHLGKEVMVRQVNPAGGYLSQSSKTLHFGLGDRTQIDWTEIRWPSGLRQRLDHPAINTLHPITEPKGGAG